MTQFIVRILFSGMMAFIPNSDGTQVDIVLLNVGHGHAVSDSTALEHHKPLLLTRAGNCSGTCPKRDASIATYVFGDLSTGAAQDALEAAVSGGGAWDLTGSELSLRKGSSSAPELPALSFRNGGRTTIIPTTSAQREDYSWLADFNEICPTCTLDSSVLASQPPSGLVAARFRLRTGSLFTYSVARIGSNVTPVQFKRLDGQGSASSYSQAIATWIGADITVTGDNIVLEETKFNGGTGRTMTLTPDANGKVEVAVINLPQLVPVAPTGTPGVGKHFERYYDLVQTPPSASARLVPLAGAAAGSPSYPEVSWSSIHPQSAVWSDLLNAIRLNPARSAYEITLCPPTNGP